MAEAEEKVVQEVIADDSVGRVMIADDVIAIIAGFAATETKGVSSMAGNITNELVGKVSRKNLQKGIRVETVDGVVNANISIDIEYGYSIPKVCTAVQERVKTAIENMTGLKVGEVNIQVASVDVDNSK